MTTLSPVLRAMRASASGSRASVFGVGSTTVRPPAFLNSKISSWATCSSVRRRLSRLELKFWRTQPRFARLTGSHARPLSLAAAGSTNITLKSISRCSCGSAMPTASAGIGPSTVCSCPASGPGMARLERDRRRLEAERRRDPVVRVEEALPPRLPFVARGDVREELQALVLPLLDDVQVRRIFLDERLHERPRVADVARLVADPRTVV